MDSKLTLSLSLPYYCHDRNERLRPSAFMDLAQDVAVRGADQLGFSDDKLSSSIDAVWVLARMQFRYIRPLARHEDITMETWHRGLNGLFFVRDYRLLGADGEPSMLATSSWIVMDRTTRRMVRSDSLEIVDFTAQNTAFAIEEPAPKVAMPRGVQPEHLGDHVVSYSDIDTNQHANNAKYIQWVMDVLPESLTRDRAVSEVTINFNREAVPGEAVSLLHIETPDGAHIVEGRASDQQVFISKITFEQP